MIPSTALGLAFFVVLLAPGLAYVLRHERSVPAVVLSPFRETVRVLFASVVCLAVTGLLFAIVHAVRPRVTPDVRGLVNDHGAYLRAHYTQAAWWAIGLLAFAILLGFIASDPRVIAGIAGLRRSRFGRWLLGESRISPMSAWEKAFSEINRGAYSETYVGAQMDDGAYISGYLTSHNPQTSEDGNREIVLTRARMRTKDGEVHDIGSTLTIISARAITRLDITHLTEEAAPEAENAEASASHT